MRTEWSLHGESTAVQQWTASSRKAGSVERDDAAKAYQPRLRGGEWNAINNNIIIHKKVRFAEANNESNESNVAAYHATDEDYENVNQDDVNKDDVNADDTDDDEKTCDVKAKASMEWRQAEGGYGLCYVTYVKGEDDE